MASKQQSVSIDIGPQQIKILALKRTKASVSLQGLQTASLPKYQTKQTKGFEFPQVLKQTYEKTGCKYKKISCFSPGRQTLIKHITLPPATKYNLSKVAKYEIQQHLPIAEDKAVFDYQLFKKKETAGYDLLLGMSKADEVEERIGYIESAGLEVSVLATPAIALFNAYYYNYDPDEDFSAIVNIGADQTEIIIQEAGLLYYARSIPKGGDSITSDIQNKLKVTEQEAKRLKEAEAKIYLEQADSGKENIEAVQKILVTCLDEIAREIDTTFRSFFQEHAQLKNTSVKKVYLSGGTSLLPGIDRFMSEQLDVPVELLNPLLKIDIAPGLDAGHIRNISSSLAAGIGLGLEDLGLAPIKINLLPQHIKKQRQSMSRFKYIVLSIILGVSIILTPLTRTALSYRYTKSALHRVESILAEHESFLPDVKKLREENNQVKGQTDVLKNIEAHNKIWLTHLSALSGLTPEGVCFDTMLVKLTEQGTIDYFILKGSASDYETIEKLNANLEKSQEYRQIKMAKVDDGIERLSGGRYGFKDNGLSFMFYLMPSQSLLNIKTVKEETKNEGKDR